MDGPLYKECVNLCDSPVITMHTDWSSEGGEGDEETQSDIVLDIFEQLMSLEGQEQVFTELMQERSLDGYTPFMAAVTLKVRRWEILTYDENSF